ncbi:hypothetical protein D3C85_1049230 [compost metagenome]
MLAPSMAPRRPITSSAPPPMITPRPIAPLSTAVCRAVAGTVWAPAMLNTQVCRPVNSAEMATPQTISKVATASRFNSGPSRPRVSSAPAMAIRARRMKSLR